MTKLLELDTIFNRHCLEGLKSLPDNSVQCCVTSPPYWMMRDYGVIGQLGIEATPEDYVTTLTCVFDEVRRVLRPDGTLWLNIGDGYWGSGKGGKSETYKKNHKQFGKITKNIAALGTPTIGRHQELKAKDLIGIPWMVAFSLRKRGWWLRTDIIWSKPNCMPQNVNDRCTRNHEYIFMLTKSSKYYYDAASIAENCITNENRPPGIVRNRLYNYNSKQNRHPKAFFESSKPSLYTEEQNNKRITYDYKKRKKNKRSVWIIKTKPNRKAHFAMFPIELPATCILAGSRPGDVILDPFMGAGTLAAKRLGRHYIGFEIKPEFVKISEQQLSEMELFKTSV